LNRGGTQDSGEVGDEMLLAGIAQVVGDAGPVGGVAVAYLGGGGEQALALQQPFKADAEIIAEGLLQPAITFAECLGDRRHGGEVLVGFDGGNDVVDEGDRPVGRRRGQACHDGRDGCIVIKGEDGFDA
jgi:hypothetical protein